MKMKCHTSITAIFISTVIGIIIAFTFYPFVPELPLLLIPSLTISLPTLYFAIFKKEVITIKFLLIISTVFLLIVNAINLVGFWLSYQIHYGSNTTHLILWDNVICYSNAAAFLSLGTFIPFISIPKKWWVNILIYAFTSVTVCGIACLLYNTVSDKSPSPIITLFISILLFIIGCISYSSLKRKQKVGEHIEKM